MNAIGLDISADFFTASCVDANFLTIFYGQQFDQTPEGFDSFLAYLHEREFVSGSVCMEATGVYSEKIAYYLHEQGYHVFVEPPLAIHKALYEEDKTDPIDSRQIAEYVFRYPDRLHRWQPTLEIVDQLQTLLMTRDHLTKMQTASKNTRKSLQRKYHDMQAFERIYTELIDDFETRITDIDREIPALIKTNPELWRKTEDILSIKNVGILLTVNLLVLTDGYTAHVKYTSLAKCIGVYPRKHQSGSSINKRPRGSGIGPRRLRKLLYLAAMRMRKNSPEMQTYFERKVAEGKEPRLVLNNIENRILKLICGVLKSGKPYIANYRSVNPASH